MSKPIKTMKSAKDKDHLFKSYSLLISDTEELKIAEMIDSVWITISRIENKKEVDYVHLELNKKSAFWKGLVIAINECDKNE